MRILHLIPTLGPGGSERQLYYLCAGLAALGHRVHVVAMVDGVWGDPVRGTGATLEIVGPHSGVDPRLLPRFLGIIRRTDAEVVQTWGRGMDAAGPAAWLLRRPWVFGERMVWLPTRHGRELLRRQLARHSAAIVANSEHAAGGVRRALGPAGRKVQVIENALPLDEIAAAPPADRAALGIAPAAPLLLYVGRFDAEKNIPLLTRALATVLAERPEAVAVLCGVGEGLDAFRGEMAARGLGARCHSLGFRKDVWSWMKAADLLVSTSVFEGQPNTVLEAMAAGCPLVLSDIPGHREAAGDEARYFPSPARPTSAPDPADARAVARALLAALDDRPDARRRAEAARARVAARSVPAMTSAFTALYARLAPAASSSRR